MLCRCAVVGHMKLQPCLFHYRSQPHLQHFGKACLLLPLVIRAGSGCRLLSGPGGAIRHFAPSRLLVKASDTLDKVTILPRIGNQTIIGLLHLRGTGRPAGDIETRNERAPFGKLHTRQARGRVVSNHPTHGGRRTCSAVVLRGATQGQISRRAAGVAGAGGGSADTARAGSGSTETLPSGGTSMQWSPTSRSVSGIERTTEFARDWHVDAPASSSATAGVHDARSRTHFAGSSYSSAGAHKAATSTGAAGAAAAWMGTEVVAWEGDGACEVEVPLAEEVNAKDSEAKDAAADATVVLRGVRSV